MKQKIRNSIVTCIQLCSLLTHASDVLVQSPAERLYKTAQERAVIDFTQKNPDVSWFEQAPANIRQLVFQRACQENNYGLIRFLGKTALINPLQPNAEGNAPIHVAAAHQRFRAITALSELGVSLQSKNAEGLLPIHVAAQAGHEHLTKYLYDGKTKEYATPKGERLEHYIARGGNIALWEWLEKHAGPGIINSRDNNDYTPALRAARCKQEELALHLLHKYPHVKEQLTNGWPFMCIATQCGLKELVLALLSLGETFLAANPRGTTAAQLAGHFGHLKLVKTALEECKVDIHHRNGVGWDMLQYALFSPNDEVFIYLVEKACADPYANAGEGYEGNKPGSPIHNVALVGRHTLMQWLADQDYDLDRKDPNGKIPLDYTECTQEDEEAIKHASKWPEFTESLEQRRRNKAQTASIITAWMLRKQKLQDQQ